MGVLGKISIKFYVKNFIGVQNLKMKARLKVLKDELIHFIKKALILIVISILLVPLVFASSETPATVNRDMNFIDKACFMMGSEEYVTETDKNDVPIAQIVIPSAKKVEILANKQNQRSSTNEIKHSS